MKKIILILFFSLTLFANSNSCMLDVYFGNGVNNDAQEAEKSKDELAIFMQTNHPNRFNLADEGVTYNFNYAHNETYGVINDLIETHWQLYESGQISELYFSFAANALDGVDNTNSNEEAFRERLRDIITQYDIDVTNMFSLYKNNSFKNNHNVLLIAHSQGNLFGNKMYELLSSDEKQKFKMVSVATPANNVAAGGGYTTLYGDLVIKIIPDSLDPNAHGFGHTFVESYLNNPIYESVETIASNIRTATNLLDQNSCAIYKYFRFIAYMCPSRSDTELEVGIYGTWVINSSGVLKEELVTNDSKIRIPRDSNGQCPLQGWDYTTDIPTYDKDGCAAYRFDDTSYQTLDHIAGQTYDNGYTCAQYKLSSGTYDTLKALEQ